MVGSWGGHWQFGKKIKQEKGVSKPDLINISTVQPDPVICISPTPARICAMLRQIVFWLSIQTEYALCVRQYTLPQLAL
jgi:hypothetical protein